MPYRGVGRRFSRRPPVRRPRGYPDAPTPAMNADQPPADRTATPTVVSRASNDAASWYRHGHTSVGCRQGRPLGRIVPQRLSVTSACSSPDGPARGLRSVRRYQRCNAGPGCEPTVPALLFVWTRQPLPLPRWALDAPAKCQVCNFGPRVTVAVRNVTGYPIRAVSTTFFHHSRDGGAGAARLRFV
jgi:hypothetical protein